jgi:predicted porin
MRLSYITAAALALIGAAAHAQSSVTLFGIVDTAVEYGKGSGPGSTSKTALTSGGINTSRIGMRGSEDLGNGMSASFWLEAGFNADDGQFSASNSNNQASGTGTAVAGRQGMTFNRRSTVSLSGGFGEVRVGRDYTAAYVNLYTFDPFGNNGIGTSQTAVGSWAVYPGGSSGLGTRASNSVAYFLPATLGGFYGEAMYYLGENSANGTPTSNDGRGVSLRGGYAAGPLNTALAYQHTKMSTGDITTTNLAGDYNFGVARLMAHINRDRFDAPTSQTGKGWLVGGIVPVGAGEIRLAYSQYSVDTGVTDPKTRKLALGYVYNFTKRTAVYTTVARVTNKGGAAMALGGALTAADGSSSGVDIGIRHIF